MFKHVHFSPSYDVSKLSDDELKTLLHYYMTSGAYSNISGSTEHFAPLPYSRSKIINHLNKFNILNFLPVNLEMQMISILYKVVYGIDIISVMCDQTREVRINGTEARLFLFSNYIYNLFGEEEVGKKLAMQLRNFYQMSNIGDIFDSMRTINSDYRQATRNMYISMGSKLCDIIHLEFTSKFMIPGGDNEIANSIIFAWQLSNIDLHKAVLFMNGLSQNGFLERMKYHHHQQYVKINTVYYRVPSEFLLHDEVLGISALKPANAVRNRRGRKILKFEDLVNLQSNHIKNYLSIEPSCLEPILLSLGYEPYGSRVIDYYSFFIVLEGKTSHVTRNTPPARATIHDANPSTGTTREMVFYEFSKLNAVHRESLESFWCIRGAITKINPAVFDEYLFLFKHINTSFFTHGDWKINNVLYDYKLAIRRDGDATGAPPGVTSTEKLFKILTHMKYLIRVKFGLAMIHDVPIISFESQRDKDLFLTAPHNIFVTVYGYTYLPKGEDSGIMRPLRFEELTENSPVKTRINSPYKFSTSS
jgi:hypothetical protein